MEQKYRRPTGRHINEYKNKNITEDTKVCGVCYEKFKKISEEIFKEAGRSSQRQQNLHRLIKRLSLKLRCRQILKPQFAVLSYMKK